MSRATVLIADDDRDFTAALRRRLVSENHAVLVAASRAQAQEMAQSENPDVIILGAVEPRGDAFKFYQWLKSTPQLKELPIIVVDAPPEKQFIKGWRRDEGLRLDCDDYLTRPIDQEALVARIDKFMDRETSRITVLVADDHAVVRDGIRAVIDLQRDMQVIGEAVDGREAVEKARQLSPDVILMDIVMPEMNGLDATKQICQEGGSSKVLILSQYDDQETIKGSEEAGALGFIPKRSASSELIAGIRSASQGRPFQDFS